MPNAVMACVLTAALVPAYVPRLMPNTHDRKAVPQMADAMQSEHRKLYNVYLENDSHNMREYVVRTLMMVCDISESDAFSITQEANDNWMSLCGTWEHAIAEHIFTGLRKAGLSATMTSASDNDGEEDDDPRPRYLDGTLIESESDLPGWYQ